MPWYILDDDAKNIRARRALRVDEQVRYRDGPEGHTDVGESEALVRGPRVSLEVQGSYSSPELLT